MKNMMKRLLTTLVIFALVFTCIPAISGTLEADAAAKPAKVQGFKHTSIEKTSAKKKKKKVSKNLKGYTIYRNGKAIKNLGKNTTRFKDSGLKSGRTYSYYIRAYNIVNQKQWFNNKTGKWQTQKPAKKIRGKSRKVKVKQYGKSSSKITANNLL